MSVQPYSSFDEIDADTERYDRNMSRICESREPDDFRVQAVDEVHARLLATARAYELLRGAEGDTPKTHSPTTLASPETP